MARRHGRGRPIRAAREARRRGPIAAFGASFQADGRAMMDRFDPRTALVVVDLQNDFADPAGQPGRGRRRGDDPGRERARSGDAVEAGALVVATQDWHPESHAALRARTAASGRSTASPARGARSCTRPSSSRPRRRASARASTARTATPASPCATRSAARRSRPSSRRCSATAASSGWSCAAWRPTTASSATALDARRLGFSVELLADAIAAVDLEAGRRRPRAGEDGEAGVAHRLGERSGRGAAPGR